MNTRLTTMMIGACVLVSGLAVASPPQIDREAEIRRTLRQATDATGVDLEAAVYGPIDRPSRRERVEARLSRFDEMDLPVRPAGPTPVNYTFDLVLDDEPVRVTGVKHSLRAPGVQFLADRGNGLMEPLDPGPVRTYRGTIDGEPDATVCFTLRSNGISAFIRRGGSSWQVEPLDGPDADGLAPHAVYRPTDVRDSGGTCGVTGDHRVGDLPDLVPAQGGVAAAAGGTTYVAEIAFDADYDFYDELALGSTENVWDEIVSRLNEVDAIYESEVDISYILTAAIVPASSNDPYTTTNSSGRLCEMAVEWINNQTSIPRDLTHLMTGVNLDGDTIGLAYEGGLYVDPAGCVPNGAAASCPAAGSPTFLSYGLTQVFGLTPDQRRSVMAHELGHNWGACHCNEGGCTPIPYTNCLLMHSDINDPPSTTFTSDSRDQIIATRNAMASCLLDTCSSGCCGSIVFVGTSAEVTAAMASVSCGSEIVCEPGTYFSVSLLQRPAGSRVLITTPGASAVFE